MRPSAASRPKNNAWMLISTYLFDDGLRKCLAHGDGVLIWNSAAARLPVGGGVCSGRLGRQMEGGVVPQSSSGMCSWASVGLKMPKRENRPKGCEEAGNGFWVAQKFSSLSPALGVCWVQKWWKRGWRRRAGHKSFGVTTAAKAAKAKWVRGVGEEAKSSSNPLSMAYLTDFNKNGT